MKNIITIIHSINESIKHFMIRQIFFRYLAYCQRYSLQNKLERVRPCCCWFNEAKSDICTLVSIFHL